LPQAPIGFPSEIAVAASYNETFLAAFSPPSASTAAEGKLSTRVQGLSEASGKLAENHQHARKAPSRRPGWQKATRKGQS